MMKKLVLFLVAVTAIGSAAMAQLGAPRITVKDTLIVTSCVYNETELDYADWPADFLVEDAVQIQVAGYVYKKGKPNYTAPYRYDPSWGGHIYYYHYRAICNGKEANISIWKLHKDCDTPIYGVYTIDDYSFYVMKKDDFVNMMRE